MRTSRMMLPVVILVLAVAGIVWAQALQPLDKVTGFGPTKIVTQMTGDQEIGSVATRSHGTASFEIRSDGALQYKIDTSGITGVTGVVIQQGRAGQVGPVVARLYMPAQPTGYVKGVLAAGTVRAADLTGPLAGKSVNDLAKLMMDNNAYVNITTAIYSDGQLRGNIPYPYATGGYPGPELQPE